MALNRIVNSGQFIDSNLPRLLVLDVSKPGGSGATGQLSRTLFGRWPLGQLMHLHWDAFWSWRLFDGERSELVRIDSVARLCRAFRPELIYYRPVPFPISFHQMALSLLEKLECPYVVHLMDDWMKRLEVSGDEGHEMFERSIQALLKNASQRFSICDAMTQAFQIRYGVPFVAAANGVERERIVTAPKSLTKERPFTIRYCGGLADDMTRRSIERLAEVVEKVQVAVSVKLEVYTKSHYELLAAKNLIGHSGVAVYESVPDSEYEELLRTADALVIAYNFDRLSRDYVRYSFANKLPECMASGTPILAFGPIECASIRYLAENECAIVVDQDDRGLLERAVGRLISDGDLRSDLSYRASNLVRENFLLEENRAQFYSELSIASRTEVKSITAESLCPHPAPFPGSFRMKESVVFNEFRFLDSLLDDRQDASLVKAVRTLDSTSNYWWKSAEALGWESKEELDGSEGSSVVCIEEYGTALSRLMGYQWSKVMPEGVIVRFEDRKSEVEGFNTHQLAIFLRRKGYRVFLSEWYPRESGSSPAWRRLCPYPCCLASPLAWGRVVAAREDVPIGAIDQAVKQGLVWEDEEIELEVEERT